MRIALALCVFVALTALGAVARAEPRAEPSTEPRDEAPALGVESDARSRWIWRGVAWSRGPVVMPSAWGEARGWRAAAWAGFPFARDAPQPSATVATVERELSWWRVDVAPGVAAYDAPRARVRTTVEATLDVAIDLGDVRVVTTHALDLGGRAYFGAAGVDYERSSGRLTLTFVARVGWASAALDREYFRRDVAAVTAAEASVAGRYDLTDVFYAVLHAEGSTLVAPSLRRSAEPTLASVGASLGFEL